MTNTLSHKDHRTVPLSITTKITVEEKEELGCAYTKPGEKIWFPVRQKAHFSEAAFLVKEEAHLLMFALTPGKDG